MAIFLIFCLVSIYLTYSIHGQEQTWNQWNHNNVLITGAANGIGKAVVELILEEGAEHVAIVDIDKCSGISVQNAMNAQYGNKVKFHECDVRNDTKLREVFASVIRDWGYIDIVINDAGIADDSNPISTINTNLCGVISGTLIALEYMNIERGGKGGTVINIASEQAISLSYLIPVYASTKAGVLHFSSCIGMEQYYNRTGMRVMSICFGFTDTAILNNVNSFDPELVTEFQNSADNARNRSHGIQSAYSAALGVDAMFKNGASGDVWLSIHDKPAIDITATHKQWFSSMAPYLS